MSDVLHYRGNRLDFAENHPLGPDRFGAYYAPVRATYDFDADMTTMELRPIPPAELQERLRALNLDFWGNH